MNKIINMLESKWGCFEKDSYYVKQCDMSNGRKKSYLNVLFNSIDNKEYIFAEQMLDCKIPKKLKEFYQQYNGIMLFFESLRIYGVELGEDTLYDSLDIVQQNEIENISDINSSFSEMVIFGYYSSCLFCFNKNGNDIFYVVDKHQKKVVYEFKNIEDLLFHYVNYLISEYDVNGKKIHYNPQYEGLPMANISLEFI